MGGAAARLRRKRRRASRQRRGKDDIDGYGAAVTNAFLVVVSLAAAFLLTLTITGDLLGRFQVELIVGPLVLGWPLLLCAWPLYLWLFRRLAQSGPRAWWTLPVAGALLFPIPVAVAFLPEVFDPGGVERLRVGLLRRPVIVGMYVNYALFGFFLGILYTVRQRAGSSSRK